MSLGEPYAVAALQWLGSLCDFMLEVSLAYCLCWILARFSISAAVRFAVWTTFLLGSATCWLLMLLRALVSVHADPMRTTISRSASPLPPAPNWAVPAPAAGAISHALPLLGILYLSTLCVLAVASLHRQRRLNEVLSFRTAPPAALHRALESLAGQMGVGTCQLWLLPALPSPATTGWLTPCIYLPPECGEEDGLALENILRHELAHVRRRDTAWEAAARLCRALLFFHPALHAAFAALHLERELACDLIVLRAQPDKRDVYADVLVRFGWKALAPGRTNRQKIGIAFAASAAVLHSRVQAILAGEAAPSPGACTLRGLLSACAFCLAGLLAPALWVGFHLPASRPVTSTAAEPTVQLLRHTKRVRAVFRPVPGPTVPFLTTAASPEPQPAVAMLLPTMEAAPLREIRYHSDAPVLTQLDAARVEGQADDESTGGQLPGAAPRRRSRGVSASTVTALVGAAIALHGVLDHDHGRD